MTACAPWRATRACASSVPSWPLAPVSRMRGVAHSDHSQFTPGLAKGVQRLLQVGAAVQRAHLHPDARLAARHHREEEADHIDPQRQQAGGQLLRGLGLVDHDRDDGVLSRLDVEAQSGEALAEEAGVVFQPVAQRGVGLEQVEHRQAGADDGRCHGVGEQVGARALAQQRDHVAAGGGEAATGAAQGLAQGAGDDVDAAEHTAQLVRAAPARAQEAGGVALVDAQQGTELVTQRPDRVQPRDGAVHGEHAVGEHQDVARAGFGGGLQLPAQVVQVVVRVAVALRLAQADAVDDGGVVQLVADDGVLLAQQGFEKATVGVEGRAVEDAVLGAQEGGQPGLQRLVDVLRAADEAHRTQAEAALVQALVRGRDHRRVGRQAQVVVGAQVEHLGAVAGADQAALGCGDDALVLVQAGLARGLQLGGHPGVE
jgi:hypothetical protein